MGHLSSMFNGLARSLSIKKAKTNGNGDGREAAVAMAKEAKKNDLVLHSSGFVNLDTSDNFATVFSKRGQKGVNQDCAIVWEEFGCQEDMLFCGIFDGHGHWGHFVAKQVRDSLPSLLLCNWQDTLAQASSFELDSDKKIEPFTQWKHCFLKTCASIDQELKQQRKIDTYNSGTTALSIVRQGDMLYIANVGDSRAILATTSDDGSLGPIQLTIDSKPNLPQEAERINQCKGRIFCLRDEPGVHRVWLPDDDAPGLAMSRAFGDYCLKDFGVISVPEVTQRRVTKRDHFVILASDGVWDVVSNEEAVEIVSSAATEREKAAKCLVAHATRAWKRKRRGIAMDDMSAVCLFLHSSSVSQSQNITPLP